jgi:hypothetical protein
MYGFHLFLFNTYLVYSDCFILIDCGQNDCVHPKISKTDKEKGLIELISYDLKKEWDRLVMIVHIMILTEMSQKLSTMFPPKREFFKIYNRETISRMRDGNNFINYSIRIQIPINIMCLLYSR